MGNSLTTVCVCVCLCVIYEKKRKCFTRLKLFALTKKTSKR